MTLHIHEFGNPILRRKAKRLTAAEIRSDKIQTLIHDMRTMLISKKLGIGLAAPQIGEPVALSVIAVRPTKHRPAVKKFDLVIINPKITKYIGKPRQMWEGCISSGSGKANLFAKVPRYNQVELSYLDEHGQKQTKQFSGLPAQVIQHETDHLNGVLFVDKVTDTRTYMTDHEYTERVRKKA